MPTHTKYLDKSAGPVRRALFYAFYDWTREMSKPKRVVAVTGIFLQGYAIWGLWSGTLIWPLTWPAKPMLYVMVWLMYMAGYFVLNGALTSEFVRKTQLEGDEMAAREIQRTLQPEKIEPLEDYELETFYRPFRAVGGDYFDVIQLGGDRTLFALADVSGKGMAAALLASNIQALVRSIAITDVPPATLATRINQHLSRYSPRNRFATAIFVVLSRDSGELSYVNAGHNPAMMCGSQTTTFLEATGLPLGLFAGTRYEAAQAVLARGDTLLLFTDGLTDSIPGDKQYEALRGAIGPDVRTSLSNLSALTDPKLIEDDIAILLLKRRPA